MLQEGAAVLTSKPTKAVPPHGLLYVNQREMAVVSAEDGTHMFNNQCIDRTLKMMSDALTNTGKRVTSNIACANSQRNTND